MQEALKQRTQERLIQEHLYHFTDALCLVDAQSAACTEYAVDHDTNDLILLRALHYDEWLIDLARNMYQADTVAFFSKMSLQAICHYLEQVGDCYTMYYRVQKGETFQEFEVRSFYTDAGHSTIAVCRKELSAYQPRPLETSDKLRQMQERFEFMAEHTVENFIEIQASTGVCFMYSRGGKMERFGTLKEQIAWWAEHLIVPEERLDYIREFELDHLLQILRKQNGYHSSTYRVQDNGNLTYRIVSTLHQRKWGNKEECIFAYAQDMTTEKEQEQRNKQLVDISQQLLNLSQSEPVTGLYNRAAGEKFIEEYLCVPGNRGTLLLIDVDVFKSFNDRYGHQTGDFVLKFLGKSMQDIFRSDDLICRWGGDEFLVFMRNIHQIHMIESRIERLRAKIRQCKKENLSLQITVSIGGAVATCDTNLKALFARCDKQLYQVKENGRDGFSVDRGQPTEPCSL